MNLELIADIKNADGLIRAQKELKAYMVSNPCLISVFSSNICLNENRWRIQGVCKRRSTILDESYGLPRATEAATYETRETIWGWYQKISKRNCWVRPVSRSASCVLKTFFLFSPDGKIKSLLTASAVSLKTFTSFRSRVLLHRQVLLSSYL